MPGSPGTTPPAEAAAGARLALVIATGTYSDTGLQRLRAPATDAADLAQVLSDPAIGGFAVTTVLDQPAQEVRVAVEEFLSGRGTRDLLLVYLSCHGLRDARNRLYFAASDTRKDRLGSTGVEAAWLLDQLEHCRARRQVLILDSCFSGAFAHGAKGETGLDLEGRFLGQGRGRVVLTASSATEYSFEGQPTGAASPAGSVFTAALVQGLRTGAADGDGDGHVSVDDAYRYVFDQVQAAGAAQTPERWLYGGVGAIVLARSPLGPAVTPAPLPEAIQAALESPYPAIRAGAVTELGEWLASGDQARVMAARQRLGRVTETDIPSVAGAARRLLDAAPAGSPSSASPAGQAESPGPSRQAMARPTGAPAIRPPEGRPAGKAGPVSIVSLFELRRGRLRRPGAVNALAFSPDGAVIATAASDRRVRLWDVRTGKHIRTLDESPRAVHAVAFSPDGQLLAVGCANLDDSGALAGSVPWGAVQLWHPGTGRCQRTLKSEMLGVLALAFRPGGKTLAVAGHESVSSFSSPVEFWDPSEPRLLDDGFPAPPVWPPPKLISGRIKSEQLCVHAVAYSADGSLVATAWDDGRVVITAPARRRSWLVSREGHKGAVFDAAISSDGGLVATAGYDQTVRVWAITIPEPDQEMDSKCRWAVTGHDLAALAVALSPDGRLLASAGRDGNVVLWDLRTGDRCAVLPRHEAAVPAVAFSPDGRLLATGCEDGIARIWRFESAGSAGLEARTRWSAPGDSGRSDGLLKPSAQPTLVRTQHMPSCFRTSWPVSPDGDAGSGVSGRAAYRLLVKLCGPLVGRGGNPRTYSGRPGRPSLARCDRWTTLPPHRRLGR